jgi:mannose-6-phosphate isomerase-like protein (cupin superfamily)
MVDVRTMTPEQKEAFHQAAEARIKTFSYRKPEGDKVKEVTLLTRGEHIRGMVQIVKDGGENNLHYHTHSDTIWMVLKGRVRFYGPEDKVLGEFGQHDGILMPGGARYWFEKIGDEDLEILQMVGLDKSAGAAQRINVEKHKAWMEGESILTVYEPTP